MTLDTILKNFDKMTKPQIKNALQKLAGPPDRIYSAKEVAKILGKAPLTIRVSAPKYKIGTKIGKVWTFTEDDIEALRQIPRPGAPSKQKV